MSCEAIMSLSSSCWAACSAAVSARAYPRFGPDVVGLDLSAEAARGGDGLEPRYADAQHQDVGGFRRAGRCREQREVTPEGFCGYEDCFVAGDVGLRR
jgi:hypothetical protein